MSKVTQEISIHALREESDDFVPVDVEEQEISIHALREESDFITSNFALNVLKLFQSTLSVRRATFLRAMWLRDISISIHALREESDYFLICESD